MQKAYIFGAGKWGKLAFYYYEDQYEIVGFLDNDAKKWGQYLCGREIYSIQALQAVKDVLVILAISNEKAKQLVEQQLSECGTDGIIVFQAQWHAKMLKSSEKAKENQLIVCFRSGLGNQMFQYALYLYLQSKKKRVYADLSDYVYLHDAKFQLKEVFKGVKLKYCDQNLKCNYNNRFKYGDTELGFVESDAHKVRSPINLYELEKMKFGIIKGYFQTFRIAEEVKDKLRESFEFKIPDDKALKDMIHKFEVNNYVSVHIRRKDYLLKDANDMFGGICTQQYYYQSVKYIQEKEENIKIVFFSDDIEWVKKNYKIDQAIYIEDKMFDDYHDWYDMYLMSKCKHNIIANSTFSWWGAWLNNNKNKIVIAPEKWANVDSFEDICPPDWIRL